MRFCSSWRCVSFIIDLRLERTLIHAPADGVVVMPDGTPLPDPNSFIGQRVTAGTAIFTIEKPAGMPASPAEDAPAEASPGADAR